MNYVDKDEKFRWALLSIAFVFVILFVMIPKIVKGISKPKPPETTTSVSTTQESTTKENTTATTEKPTTTTTKPPETTTETTTETATQAPTTTEPPTTEPTTAREPFNEEIIKIVVKNGEIFLQRIPGHIKDILPEPKPEPTTQPTTQYQPPYVPPTTKAPATTKPPTTKPPTTTTTQPLEQTWTIIGIVKEVSGNNVGITQNGGKTIQHFSLRNGAVGISVGQKIVITGHKNQNGEVWYTH